MQYYYTIHGGDCEKLDSLQDWARFTSLPPKDTGALVSFPYAGVAIKVHSSLKNPNHPPKNRDTIDSP
jgi:hypothetical protein